MCYVEYINLQSLLRVIIEIVSCVFSKEKLQLFTIDLLIEKLNLAEHKICLDKIVFIRLLDEVLVRHESKYMPNNFENKDKFGNWMYKRMFK